MRSVTLSRFSLLAHACIELAAPLTLLLPALRPAFFLTYFNEHPSLALSVGFILGLLRLAAFLLLGHAPDKGRQLAKPVSVATLILAPLYIPVGILDALLAVLVLLGLSQSQSKHAEETET